jgi:cytosine/adenosine deaminase-related metal-dependent hydrolase
MFERQGFLRRGVSIIHGVALGSAQFEQMATKGIGLIWSPRSNIELYGVTTDVAAAKRANVKISLAPDWSPSGSDGVLEELKFAATWNAGQPNAIFSDQDLVNMVTTIPAELAGVSDRVGSLKPGMYADILLIKRGSTNPYEALVHSSVSDVRLVVINGVPIYGDTDLMNRLLPRRQLEQLTVCGTSKSLYIQPGEKGWMKPWKQVSESLSSELATWGTSLAPLAVCDGTNLH